MLCLKKYRRKNEFLKDTNQAVTKNCPRKIRDKEQRDMNEFFEWRFEKVSNCWLR